MQSICLVFIGGGLGSLCRYSISLFLVSNKWQFPVATMSANVISCLMLGFLMGLVMKTEVSTAQRLLWMTGFCGGFSTFSTFSGEAFQLLRDGHIMTAMIYMLTSIIVCLICICLGVIISQKLT